MELSSPTTPTSPVRTCVKYMQRHILHGLGTSLSSPKDIQLVSNSC